MNEEIGTADQTVEVVLKKFDGDVDTDPNAVLREEIYIKDDVVEWTKFYDEVGNLITTIEGGDNGTN